LYFSNGSELYTLNTSTGAGTLIGPLGAWISAMRPSRQPPCPEGPPQAASRRGRFLRMRTFLIPSIIPHAHFQLLATLECDNPGRPGRSPRNVL
jgi:hypothetical protein